MTTVKAAFENFDDVWSLGNPAKVEKKLHKLLFQAQFKDASAYLQILSQIALAQALQKKFTEAHETLDEAEESLSPEYVLAKVRILLERGRVFQQQGSILQAKNFFKKSFELGLQHKFDYYAIDAAHMIAIVASNPKEKIEWNSRAVNMAKETEDKRAQLWLGSLYNNLGQSYIEAHKYQDALSVFKESLKFRKKENYTPNIRIAEWNIARTLRLDGKLDEALKIQNLLLKEYDSIRNGKNFDMPRAMFEVASGWVYHELSEIYREKSRSFAELGYKNLSKHKVLKEVEVERLKRLEELKSF